MTKNILRFLTCFLLIFCFACSGGDSGDGGGDGGDNGGAAAGAGGNNGNAGLAGTPGNCRSKQIVCDIDSCTLDAVVSSCARPLVLCELGIGCTLTSDGSAFDFGTCADFEIQMTDFTDHVVDNDDVELPNDQVCGQSDFCDERIICLQN